jgi:iron complex outermembrane receptor protein
MIWDSPDRRYTARIYAYNLTNRAYIEAMNDSPNLGTRYVTWGAPRQVGGEIKLVF